MIKYICLLVVVIVGEAVAKSVFPMPRLGSGCTTMAVRRDITTLGPTELQRFIHVVREMHRRGWMDGFGSMHDHISHQVHGNDQFFAWHRRFLRHFEVLMQEIDPDVVLPYWNWGTYWQNPLADPVLGPSYFGGNGRPGDSCVVDGTMARWGRNYPTRSCLTRKFRYGTSTGSFWPMRAVRDVMTTSKTHAQFRSRIENGAHGIVHLGLGGDFETMWAPVDVLFFLHHATIDKVWAEWQSRDPQRFHDVDGYDAMRQPVNAKSVMPFYGDEVGTTLSTSGPGYCYVYDDVPGPPAFFRAMNRRGAAAVAFYAPPKDADAAAEDDSSADAPRSFANSTAPVADFAPPQPMDTKWLKSMNYDVKEAARMQRLVNNVVAQINAERKETPNPS